MNWILILTLMSGSSSYSAITTVPQPFATKKACDKAGVLWEDKAQTQVNGRYAFYLCVEQGR